MRHVSWILCILVGLANAPAMASSSDAPANRRVALDSESFSARVERLRDLVDGGAVARALMLADELSNEHDQIPASDRLRMVMAYRTLVELRSYVLSEVGQNGRALALVRSALEEASAKAPDDGTLSFCLNMQIRGAESLVSLGQYDWAVDAYSSATETARMYLNETGETISVGYLFVGMAWATLENGCAREALEIAVHVGMAQLQSDPAAEQPRVRSELLAVGGRACRYLGRLDEAEKYLRTAQEISTRSAAAYTPLRESELWQAGVALDYAQLLKDRGETTRAIELCMDAIQRYLALSKREPRAVTEAEGLAEAQQLLGNLYVGRHDYGKAAELLQEASEGYERLCALDDKNSAFRADLINAYVDAAEIAKLREQLAKAREFLEKASSQDEGWQPGRSVPAAHAKYRLYKAMGDATRADVWHKPLQETAPGLLGGR